MWPTQDDGWNWVPARVCLRAMVGEMRVAGPFLSTTERLSAAFIHRVFGLPAEASSALAPLSAGVALRSAVTALRMIGAEMVSGHIDYDCVSPESQILYFRLPSMRQTAMYFCMVLNWSSWWNRKSSIWAHKLGRFVSCKGGSGVAEWGRGRWGRPPPPPKSENPKSSQGGPYDLPEM